MRSANGKEEVFALGERFPERALIAQQIAEMFRASRDPRGAAAAAAASPPAVFLSHARKDHVAVDKLDEVLRLAGYSTWMDRSRLAGGEDWSRELRQAIARCAALVVAVSPAALASPVVREEYEEALRLGKPVLAVMLRPTQSLPEALRSRLCADVSSGGSTPWRQGWAPLLLALERARVRFMEPATFNASLALSHALVEGTPPGWQVFHSTPLGRERRLFLGLAIGLGLPLIALGVALAFHANGLLVAGISAFALFLAWQFIIVIALRHRSLWLLVVTPGGAALLRMGILDSYAWSDYDAVRLGGRNEPGGVAGSAVWLRQRATGRERRIGGLEVFTPLDQAYRAVIAAFQSHLAGRAPVLQARTFRRADSASPGAGMRANE